MTTKRPKVLTVAEWEANHPEFFIGLGPECLDNCRCSLCFQKALDRLVSKTEAAANDSGTGFDQYGQLASDRVPECATAN